MRSGRNLILALFLPLQNPIGFGASDFLELVFAALLVCFTLLARPWVETYARRLAERTGWCMLLLALLPVVLRLALLPHHPVPSPDIYDEFSHLLVADTLRHFRLANPAHPLHQFFETFFVLQEPTYSSIYPVGQGLMLAAGRMLFGLAWAGVVVSTAAFCALVYWMLRAWTTPVWALLGGLLAVAEFGPLNQWMNTYWGGAEAAAAGCLVFGALPRLLVGTVRDAVLLGLGLGLHLLIRPFESIFLLVTVLLFFLPALRRRDGLRALVRAAAVVTLVVAPGDRDHTASEQEGDWQLDDVAGSVEPVSVRRAGCSYISIEPRAASGFDAATAARLSDADGVSKPGSGDSRDIFDASGLSRSLLPIFLSGSTVPGAAGVSSRTT